MSTALTSSNSNSVQSIQPNLMDMKHSTQEFLTFFLNDELYGIDILAVQEIRGIDKITQLPNVPKYMKGVVNLRGTIVPVIDLRVRFRMPEKNQDALTVMIVLQNEQRTIGLMVDQVADVMALTKEQIREKPEIGGHHTHFLSNVGIIQDKMILLLQTKRLFTMHEEAMEETEKALSVANA